MPCLLTTGKLQTLDAVTTNTWYRSVSLFKTANSALIPPHIHTHASSPHHWQTTNTSRHKLQTMSEYYLLWHNSVFHLACIQIPLTRHWMHDTIMPIWPFGKNNLHRVDNLTKHWNCGAVCMCVCSLIAREWIHQFAPNLACFFLDTRKRKVKILERVSWLRVLVRVVPVAWKLSTTEEWCQDQNCLFWWVDYRNKGRNPEKLSWVWLPVKVVAQKLSMIEEWHQDQSCFFWQGDYTNKGHNTEKCPWLESWWGWFL
jgi:hypothetical protein